MVPHHNFFIKPGYVCNNNSLTYEVENVGDFWTDERIKNSAKFQYYVYLLAARIAQKNKVKRAIDIGCGPSIKTQNLLAPLINEIILIDQPNCEALVKKLLPEAEFIAVNLEECNLKLENSVDLIICADVLEHLFNPIPCLKFALDHLSPSGIAIFSTPERDILHGKDCMRSPHEAHVREWNSSEFNQLIEYSGFKVIEQQLQPAAKMRFQEELLWKLTRGLVRPNHWKSCQVAICQKS